MLVSYARIVEIRQWGKMNEVREQKAKQGGKSSRGEKMGPGTRSVYNWRGKRD